MTELVILLLYFQIKHFLADYPLQGKFMLKKFLHDWGFFLPLLAHASVHALFTLAACLVVNPKFWWLALVDLVIHFVMDRIKAGPKYLGKYKALSAVEFKDTIDTIELIKKANWSGEELKNITLEKEHKRLKGNTYFWLSLGLDQMVHHLTDLTIAFCLVLL